MVIPAMDCLDEHFATAMISQVQQYLPTMGMYLNYITGVTQADPKSNVLKLSDYTLDITQIIQI